MDLKEFHDTVRFFMNKEQGGWISPEEIDNITDRAQMWLFAKDYDVYSKTQTIEDSLSVFSTKLDFITTAAGVLALPINPDVVPCYEHLLSLNVKYYDSLGGIYRYTGIKMMNEDEIAERLDSQILRPTVEKPVGIQSGKGEIQIYPETAIEGNCYFLRRPRKPVFVYVQTGRNLVYNKPASVQLEWGESSMNKLLIKTIQLFGVNVNDELIIQFTELKNAQEV